MIIPVRLSCDSALYNEKGAHRAREKVSSIFFLFFLYNDRGLESNTLFVSIAAAVTEKSKRKENEITIPG